MSRPEIALVYGDQWVGLYMNGKLAEQDHELDMQEVLERLGFLVTRIEADNDWLENRTGGYLPESLLRVKRAKP